MDKDWLFPSLKEITLSNLARAIFYHQVDNTDIVSGSCLESVHCFSSHTLCEKACDLVDNRLHIPRSLVELLKKLIKFVGHELNVWIEDFSATIQAYSYSTENKALLLLPSVIWAHDGFIDYEKTAINFLRDPKLSLFEKYSLACNYCMEDEIKRFWSTYPSEIDFDNESELSYPMLLYWNSIRKNKYHGIFLQGSLPVEINALIHMDRFFNADAVRFFWNRLRIEDQLQNVKLCTNPEVLICWLKSLSEAYLRKAFKENFNDILFLCTIHSSYGKNIYRIWIMVKDFCTGDEFVTLLTYLKRSVCKSSEDVNLTTNLLIDIWTSSSDELKCYAFQNESGSCIYNICSVLRYDMKELQGRDDRIIGVILADASPEFRKRFFQNECVKFLNELYNGGGKNEPSSEWSSQKQVLPH